MRIDLSADVGEGEDDLPLFKLLTSVNVACGAHAGDLETMGRCVAEAARLGVALGAHPGYPDRDGFGRREIATPAPELAASLAEQIAALAGIAREHGVRLVHVKPHGALYNQAVVDPALAEVVALAVRDVDPGLRLIGLAGSAMLDAGKAAGLPVAAEAFADRRYRADGTLAPRAMAGALMDDPLHATQQALAIAVGDLIDTVDGFPIPIMADTICLHADTPGAFAMAQRVHAGLQAAGVEIRRLDP
jgi:5-oxoprolinase (ATP-hydrolysing) subunit A